MAERRQGSTDGDHAVVQLVVDYVHCPQCDLTVPAFTGPESLALVLDGSMTRCGFCKWVFAPGPRMPLQVRHRCDDCGATMRGPQGAAVLACRVCGAWFYNPDLDPAVRDRVERILREQQRYAAVADRLLFAAERMIPPSGSPERPREDVARAGHPRRASGSAGLASWAGPLASPAAPTSPSQPRSGHPVPALHPAAAGAGNVRRLHLGRRSGDGGPASLPLLDAFPAALSRAVREALPPRQRRVLELRYGLDGRPGRTFSEIGAVIRRSPSRARALLGQALGTIAAMARQADCTESRDYLSCSIAVHLAGHALGDPLDPQAAGRIREFIDTVLPRATPGAATDLLLRLTGWRDELASAGQAQALRRAVATARGQQARG